MELVPIDQALSKLLSGNVNVKFVNTTTGNEFQYNVKVDYDNKEVWNVKPSINSPEAIGLIRAEYNTYNRDRQTYVFRNYRWEQKHVVFSAIFKRICKKYIEPNIEIYMENLIK